MLEEKTLPELQQILQQLSNKLEELNQNGTDEKKYDYPMMPRTELTQTLQSKISSKKKKKTLLTQIGLTRINLFNRHYQRIQQNEKNNKLNEAIKLMNAYVEPIAIPFISTKKPSAFAKRLKQIITPTNLPEPTEEIQKWKTIYNNWQKQETPTPKPEDYNTLKKTFITLYTISFSAKDFPPLRNKPSEHY